MKKALVAVAAALALVLASADTATAGGGGFGWSVGLRLSGDVSWRGWCDNSCGGGGGYPAPTVWPLGGPIESAPMGMPAGATFGAAPMAAPAFNSAPIHPAAFHGGQGFIYPAVAPSYWR